MADFVAVIRRAVDGLSSNTPDARAKVYDKARAAVMRQLDSMKPRPPEEMLQRQLAKLEAAIVEVEAEHAEALPPLGADGLEIAMPVAAATAAVTVSALDAPAAQPVPDYGVEATDTSGVDNHPEPAAPEAAPVIADHTPEAVEVHHRPAEPEAVERTAWAQSYEPQEAVQAQHVSVEPDWHESAPAYAAPADALPVAASETVEHIPADAVVSPDASWDESHQSAAPWEETDADTVWLKEDQPVLPAAEPLVVHPETSIADAAPDAAEAAEVAEELQSNATEAADSGFAAEAEDEPEAEIAPALEPGVAPLANASDSETAEPSVTAEPFEPLRAAAPMTEVAWEPVSIVDEPYVPQDLREDEATAEPAAEHALGEPAPEPIAVAATAKAMQGTQTAESVPASDDPWDDLDLTAAPVVAATAAGAAVAAAAGIKSAERHSPFDDVELPPRTAANQRSPRDEGVFADDWADIDTLADTTRSPKTLRPVDFEDQPVAPERPKKVIRFEPRRRFDFAVIGYLALAVLLIGGAGFGAWTFREPLTNLVNGLVSSAGQKLQPPKVEPAKTEPTKPADAKPAQNAQTPAQPPATGTAQNTTTAPGTTKPNPAPAPDPNEVADKFNQRLQADGSEVDSGVAQPQAPGQKATSVSQQNVAAADLPQPAQPGSPVTTGITPPVAAGPVVAGGQKMYLYEEKIGQTAPTATQGAVTWTLVHQKGKDGKDQAQIQGQMSVPDRNLMIIMTIKRNFDASLPASHIIEMVFQVPPNFEGGGIDSVQRIALKQTEQDRGNPLIAVPAKITDEFHMIALNDYAEAKATNLDLLKSRGWIDIPLTYRNGRRALLTLEKGQSGMDVFNTAINEWSRMDPGAAPAN